MKRRHYCLDAAAFRYLHQTSIDGGGDEPRHLLEALSAHVPPLVMCSLEMAHVNSKRGMHTNTVYSKYQGEDKTSLLGITWT